MTLYIRKQLSFLGQFFLLALAILTLSRLAIVLWQWPRIDGFTDVQAILVGGLRIDLATLSQLLFLPLLALAVHTLTPLKGYWLSRAIKVYCWVLLLVLVLMELSTPTFISEYDSRPNRLFFEYLSSPNEVFGMLFNGYLFELVIGTLLLVATGWLTRQWLKRHRGEVAVFSPASFLFLLPLLALLLLGARSGIQHRPINPAMVAFSNDRMLNTLPLNSTYSVMYALYQMGNESSAAKLYGEIPEATMLQIIGHESQELGQLVPSDMPSLHQLKPSQPFQKRNLIIVVEESLGAQFVGALGGKSLTPNIDQWRDKSWFFENLYATGTRSARGLEAITTGFLPSPARPVLKLPKAQGNFFSLAGLLSEYGYESSFIYGGESHFDNMKGFFLNNGFDLTIDQNDYANPSFVGNWGVSDEDLFSQALNYLQTKPEQPKFSLIFTSTNHTPFEFPDDKIELYEEPKQTVNNAVKYADYALGKFLQELEAKGMMENSVVMVVADHDARVWGDTLVPIEHFHIPGFIISPDIKSKVDKTLISQIDLAPTLLSLLGIDHQVPMLGHDLTQLPAGYLGRAIMQYGDNQAYWDGQEVVILRPNQQPITYPYADGHFGKESAHDSEQELLALAYAQFASWAYDKQKYRLN